jgi:hypothetical protein
VELGRGFVVCFGRVAFVLEIAYVGSLAVADDCGTLDCLSNTKALSGEFFFHFAGIDPFM